ncbi:MAG TPA: hypothetical protein VK447_06785 [Myxococcaceae bacterium]|nr:hypothetical protein [Myxococcaceae bacterium]
MSIDVRSNVRTQNPLPRQENTAAPASRPVAAQTPRPAADLFEVPVQARARAAAAPAATQGVAARSGGAADDRQFDGALIGGDGRAYPAGTPLSEVPAFTPAPGTPPRPEAGRTFIYVNGINTDKAGQEQTMQLLANATGGRVVGIHNATSGSIRDLIQAAGDKLDKGSNPAVDSLAGTVYSELRAGREVNLIGHSQGALITSRALEHVRNRLMAEDGMTRQQAEALLGNVRVETYGGAAASYPDGPQYVHTMNRSDPVSGYTGLDRRDANPGRGAVVRHFDTNHWFNKVAAHSINDTYVPRRMPFDQARAAGSN